MSKLTGKVAIVTGASKGIGASIARALAAAGAAVVVNYSSDQAGADRVVAEIAGAGGRALAVHADMSKADDIKRLFAATRQAFDGVDVLVNNAGVFRFEPLAEVTPAEFHREFDINVLGVILATQEAATQFGARGGSVINVSSVTARNPVPNSVVYSASKAALDSVTQSLARELGPRNIRVNAVAPGHTVTEGASATGIFEGETGRHLASLAPLGRLGTPEDIAPAVVFLASNDAAWITGESIRVSGGLS